MPAPVKMSKEIIAARARAVAAAKAKSAKAKAGKKAVKPKAK